MHPGQQVMVGLDVSVPTVLDVGSMTFDTQPEELVILFIILTGFITLNQYNKWPIKQKNTILISLVINKSNSLLS